MGSRQATSRRLVAACFAASLAGAASAPAVGQSFPAKPLRIIVGFAPGGGADAAARIVAEALQKKYGQAVTVENRPGAAGRLSAEAIAKAEPDGYTLGAVTGSDTIVAATDSKLTYRFPSDFRFVSMVATYPFALVTLSAGPVKSLSDLLAAAKQPGAVTYATAGIGTTQHLAGELLAAMAGVQMVHVPYKGSSPALADVLDQRVTILISSLSGSDRALVQAGKLKPLAVTSRTPSPAIPGVAPVADTVPGFEATTWIGLVVPARVPSAIAAKLSDDVQEVLRGKEVQARIAALGLEPSPSTAAEMRARVDADMSKWGRLVRERRIDLTN